MLLTLSDGVTTITLSGGSNAILGCTYFPDTAQYRESAWQPVTETAEVNLRGTRSAMRATTGNIETLLQAAQRGQATGAGPRVFVNYKPVDANAATYRSEVFDGRVVWSTDPGLRRLGDTNPTTRIAVIWTRAPGWDGPETEISLSSQIAISGDGRAHRNQ